MIRNAYSSGSKLLLIVLLSIVTFGATAQKRNAKPMKSTFETFLDTQWWLGVRFGANYTQPSSQQSFSTYSPIDYASSKLDKKYNSFQNAGVQAGMDISFYHKGFSIVLQPTYKRLNYSYTSSREWLDDAAAITFKTEFDTEQNFNFFEVPLSLRYEIFKKGKIRPFAQAGLQYSFLISANKDTKIRHTDYASGAAVSYSGGKISQGTKDSFKGYYGATGGVGAAFDYFNIRTVVAATYYYGLNSVTDQKSNFQDNTMSSLGEANDKLRINNLDISISLVFPLRYIDKTFQPY
jgi:hypothetical protein